MAFVCRPPFLKVRQSTIGGAKAGLENSQLGGISGLFKIPPRRLKLTVEQPEMPQHPEPLRRIGDGPHGFQGIGLGKGGATLGKKGLGLPH